MKKVLLLLCLTLVSCFTEPKKESQSTDEPYKIEKSETIIADSATEPIIEDNLDNTNVSSITLTDLENLLNSNKNDFEKWVVSKGYKINGFQKESTNYEKTDSEYIVSYYDQVGKKSHFLFYTVDEKLFNRIYKECQKSYDLTNSSEDETSSNYFFSNNNYKIMFAKYSAGNYSISMSINEKI